MKKALIIAPDYPEPYVLPTAPANIAAWAGALGARGFDSIQVMQGNQTRTAILAGIRAFAASLMAGDSGALVLAGHGSQLPSTEPDGWDECFVSSDIRGIRDNELANTMAPAKNRGVKVDVVAEFCYAGTATDNRLRTWCACGPNQTSWYGTDPITGQKISVFTFYLTRVLTNYPTLPASTIISWVKYYLTTSSPQIPQLDGGPVNVIPF